MVKNISVKHAGDKPKKPHPDFPLFPHASNRWCKKVKGKAYYFGKVSTDPEGKAAIQDWFNRKDGILAGCDVPERMSTRSAGMPVTITDVCDSFIAHKKNMDLRPSRPTSRARQWFFRLTAIVVFPLLFLTILEVGLRLGGYGYPTSFFIGPDAKGRYTTNPYFGWRFFPAAIARRPVSALISTKPVDTIRIFLIGSSAAQGVPEPAFNFGRILQAMLRDRYPDKKFEVINAAMTAINSHVGLEIARDCAAHKPDLFVVYMGNNEVVGPYGPGTVFQHWSPSLPLIRTNMWLKSTCVGQLVGNLMDKVRSGSSAPDTWKGMGMFMSNQVAADDPRLPATYENYRRNLTDICGVAKRAGAGVVLSTVAVNLMDCPPLAAMHRAGLSPEELAKWNSLYQAGIELERGKKWSEAIGKYEAAAKIDDRFAELPFRLGRCFAALKNFKKAKEQFVLARELDVLRFRADKQINAVVRDVAAAQKNAGVCFADPEQSLAKSDLARGGIPGKALFYEHVHFTFDGNYLVARTIFDEVEAALPQLAVSHKQDSVLSREDCARALALTIWDECQMAKFMTAMVSRPPFTNQLDHAAENAAAWAQIEEMEHYANTREAAEAAYRACETALEKNPNDWDLRCRAGKTALANGHIEAAAEHLRIAGKSVPWDAAVNAGLAAVARRCRRTDEAVAYLQKVLEFDPGQVNANFELANILFERGKIDEAIVHLKRSLEADPMYGDAHNALGKALESRGQYEAAIAEYQKGVELQPFYAPFHYNLANALELRGRIDEAIPHYQKVVEIDPSFAIGFNKLGEIFLSRKQFDEAIVNFEKSLKLKPDYKAARKNLENAKEMLKNRSGIPQKAGGPKTDQSALALPRNIVSWFASKKHQPLRLCC